MHSWMADLPPSRIRVIALGILPLLLAALSVPPRARAAVEIDANVEGIYTDLSLCGQLQEDLYAVDVPDRQGLEVELTQQRPDGGNLRLAIVDAQMQVLDIDASAQPVKRVLLGAPVPGGTYWVRVTSDEFVTAGHAWQAWRRGDLDADRCGLTMIPEHGSFWLAGNLRLDFAALNKVEMSPWDLWGLFWEPEDENQPSEATLETFDQIAELTTDPDARFDDIRTRYAADDQLRMDGTVFSVAKGEFEDISSS